MRYSRKRTLHGLSRVHRPFVLLRRWVLDCFRDHFQSLVGCGIWEKDLFWSCRIRHMGLSDSIYRRLGSNFSLAPWKISSSCRLFLSTLPWRISWIVLVSRTFPEALKPAAILKNQEKYKQTACSDAVFSFQLTIVARSPESVPCLKPGQVLVKFCSTLF